MCATLFLTVFDFDLSQLSDQWMPANCQCHHPWPFGMDDNETSAPSKSTTFATPETKQTKDHVSDQKVTASSETKEGVASTGEMRRERRTSSYLARRRREIQWFHHVSPARNDLSQLRKFIKFTRSEC